MAYAKKRRTTRRKTSRRRVGARGGYSGRRVLGKRVRRRASPRKRVGKPSHSMRRRRARTVRFRIERPAVRKIVTRQRKVF